MTVQQGGVKVRKPYFCEVYCLSPACPRCSDGGDGVKICEQQKQRGGVGRERLAEVILPEPIYTLSARGTFNTVSGSLFVFGFPFGQS